MANTNNETCFGIPIPESIKTVGAINSDFHVLVGF